jgi:transposase-like protein
MTYTRASIKTAFEAYRDNPSYHKLTAVMAAEYLSVCESTIVVWRRKLGLSEMRESRQRKEDERIPYADKEIAGFQLLDSWTRPRGIDTLLEAIRENG